jgi:FlaA1/EpsC-like NDP-sugar epimerase
MLPELRTLRLASADLLQPTVSHEPVGLSVSFVVKLKSFKITDLAKAIDNKCKFNVVGIRSGEKLHEELISLSDCDACYDFKKYFLIIQKNFLKKFGKKIINKKVNFFNSYNSKENDFLTINELKKIISNKFDNL